MNKDQKILTVALLVSIVLGPQLYDADFLEKFYGPGLRWDVSAYMVDAHYLYFTINVLLAGSIYVSRTEK
jgi:hypothetical protein